MRFLKVTHYLLTRITILVLLLLLLVSGYFLWSNSRTYSAAEDVYESLLHLKPEETEEGKADFSELRKANPDVCGWLTVTGTKIDYPVVQGKDNLYYMNRDYYGNPSLAGSIFLDTRNSSSFSDAYSLVYGHHMDDHLMFGDLDLFKDEQFFRLNSTATILTEDRVLHLQVLALLEQPDSVEEIFDPSRWESDLSQFGAFIKDNAVYVRESAVEAPGKNGRYSLQFSHAVGWFAGREPDDLDRGTADRKTKEKELRQHRIIQVCGIALKADRIRHYEKQRLSSNQNNLCSAGYAGAVSAWQDLYSANHHAKEL